MQYISNTTQNKKDMLKKIGVSSFEDLLTDIPPDLRLKDLKLPEGLSEMELLRSLRKQGQKNAHADRFISFLGGGNYDHYIPPIVGQLATRGEFITAYTPYQGEASQGTLQSIYEYQSLICLLTEMEVANASMYDGATSMAEAVLMILRHTDRKQIFIAQTVHPESLATLKTYTSNLDVEIVLIPEKGGVTDLNFLKEQISEKTACVIFQSPNFLGFLEDGPEITRISKTQGATVGVAVNPLSLSVLVPPGAYGADIVVGEGQPLGNPVSYGGPHFGFFAVTTEWMRRIPGRICGMTQDLDGKRAFVLTLQAREQHIRREKATSNICTNHALCALKATIFLTLLGDHGFRRLGELNVQGSHEAFEILKAVDGVQAYSEAPFFNEFTLKIQKDPQRLKKTLEACKILGPLALGRFDSRRKDQYLVAVTEQRSTQEVHLLAQAIKDA
jgi:glycine dehydrogenase subunit 1